MGCSTDKQEHGLGVFQEQGLWLAAGWAERKALDTVCNEQESVGTHLCLSEKGAQGLLVAPKGDSQEGGA